MKLQQYLQQVLTDLGTNDFPHQIDVRINAEQEVTEDGPHRVQFTVNSEHE